jgi:hypothetical protein
MRDEARVKAVRTERVVCTGLSASPRQMRLRQRRRSHSGRGARECSEKQQLRGALWPLSLTLSPDACDFGFAQQHRRGEGKMLARHS